MKNDGEQGAAPSAARDASPVKKQTTKQPAKRPSKKKPQEEPLEQITINTTPDALISSLDPIQLAVLQAMPDDRAVTADSLGGLGYPYGDVIAALTVLEIMGLVQKLPGAFYTKA